MSFVPTGATQDEAVFTEGTSPFVPIGGEWNDTSAALTAGKCGALRITEKRAAHVNLRNETGTEIGTTANPLIVTTTGGVASTVSVSNFPATQPVSGTISDATLAAIISGGKAAVTDAAAEASLGTLAGAIASGKMQVSDVALDALIASGALKTTDTNVANVIQANRLSMEVGGPVSVLRGVIGAGGVLPGYSTGNVIVAGTPGKWIKVYSLTVSVQPNFYATAPTFNVLVFQEGTNGTKFIWDFPLYLPGTSYQPMSFSFGSTIQTPPGFSYVTSAAGASIGLGSAPTFTVGASSGALIYYVYYSLLGAAPY